MPDSENQYLKAFGSGVRLRRHELGISQEDLAETAGLHRTYVADIERGTRNLSLVNIFKLSEALELSVSDLFSKYVDSKLGLRGQ
jgi:transcriptional regulator with XRE-family HTH domain